MNAHFEHHGISDELLLAVFDLPVTFHRCLVPVAGGVTAELMLLQAIWLTETVDPASDGWFMCSQEQWTQETGLTRWEQETARHALRRAGGQCLWRYEQPAGCFPAHQRQRWRHWVGRGVQ